jgi:hypothetical protein
MISKEMLYTIQYHGFGGVPRRASDSYIIYVI